MMPLWQFDRLDSAGSYSFDTTKDGFTLTIVMLSYYLMQDEQLDLGLTIQPVASITWRSHEMIRYKDSFLQRSSRYKQ